MEPSTPQILTINVPGRAVPKARPRLGKGSRVYTPPKTRAYENLIAWSTINEKKLRKINGLLDPPIAVSIKFYMVGNNTGDVDNLCKSVLDGMESHAYKNDRFVKKIENIEIIPCQPSEEHTEIKVWSYNY